MQIAPALLEVWLREYYFSTTIDLGCSGVQNFSMGELRELVGITQADMDAVVFNDSQSLGEPGLRGAIARRWAAWWEKQSPRSAPRRPSRSCPYSSRRCPQRPAPAPGAGHPLALPNYPSGKTRYEFACRGLDYYS